MKFIRDIIAEKTKMIATNGDPDPAEPMAEAEISEDTQSRPDGVDLVHKVASGGLSLGLTPSLAGDPPDHEDAAPIGVQEPQLAPDSAPDQDLYPEYADERAKIEDEDQFDLLADTDDISEPATDDMNGQTSPFGPLELFEGVWTKAPEETEEGGGEDFFAETAEHSETVATQHNWNQADPVSNIEANSEPDTEAPTEADTEEHAQEHTGEHIEEHTETNTEALMRTMYNVVPTAPENTAIDQMADTDEFAAIPDQPETQPLSPYQKLLRRQTTVPLDEIGEPAPEPAITAEIDTDIDADISTEEGAEPVSVAPVSMPAPAAGRARKSAGRVKTRLLGFGNDFDAGNDLFAADGATKPEPQAKFPVGWMVIVSGPGCGTAFTLFNGVSQIGRGEDQAVRLDFGDTAVSRSNHAAIAYDPEQQKFFLGHGGKTNMVRLNGNPVLSTEPLLDGAEIRLGETTLRFVGLCGPEFDWSKTQDGESDNVRFA